MAETLTSPTPADLAFAIDPNVTRDAFWDDDKFINFGKQSTESNQSYGQIGRDSTAGLFKIAATKDGAGSFEPVAVFTSDVERSRWSPAGELIHGVGEGGVVAATGNTFRAPDIVTGGAGNIAGADLTVAAGLGTGTGDVGIIDFQLPIVAATGDNIQTRASRLTLDMVASSAPTVLTMAAAQQMTISVASGNLILGTALDSDNVIVSPGRFLHGGTSPNAFHYIIQPSASSGTPVPALRVDGGFHTTLAAGVEATDINLNLARTVQFATGALALQRAYRIQNPTYAFVGVSTLTKAITFAVGGAPVAGTNATITQAYSAEFTDAVRITGTTATAFLEMDDGVTAAVSAAGEGRLRYNDTTKTFQASVDNGAYAMLGGAGSDTTAFHNGGDSFGADATLGTNDTFDLIFEADNSEAARILTTGEFVLGRTTLTTATDISEWEKNQNAASAFTVRNTTNGTGATAGSKWVISSGGTEVTAQVVVTSTLFTPAAGFEADALNIIGIGGANGIIIGTRDISPIKFKLNASEVASFLPTGEFLFGTTSLSVAADVAEFEKNQNGATRIRVENTTNGTAASAGFIAASGAQSFQLAHSAASFTPVVGINANEGYLFLGSGSASMALITQGTDPIRFVTNATEEMRLLSGGTLAHGTGEGGTVAATGNTLRAPDIITGGAGNIAGADYTIAAGIGTGTGDAGIIDFQLPIVAAAGDFIQTRASRLTLDMVASTTVLTMAAAQAFTISTAAGDLTFSPAGDTKVTGNLAVSGEFIHDFWQVNAEASNPTVAGDRPAGPTAAAPAVADTVNAGLTVLRYDDTAEEIRSLGTRRIKASLLTLDIKALWRAQTAPGDTLHDIGWKFWWREIPDGGAAPSTTWAGTNDGSKTLTEIANIANDVLFHETTETLTLVSEGILLDREYEFAISRVAPAGTNLVGDWDVRRFTMTLKG